MKEGQALWPASDLGLLLDALLRKARIERRGVAIPEPPAQLAQIPAWLETVCPALGLETTPEEVWGHRAEETLRAIAPALVPLGSGWIGLLEVRGSAAVLVTRDLSTTKVAFSGLVRDMLEPFTQPFQPGVAAMLEGCGIGPARRAKAQQILVREQVRSLMVATVWPLRAPPGSGFLKQLADAGLLRRGFLLIGSHAAQYLLWIFAWYVLGRDALQGRVDPGWMMAWALALATLVPFRLWTTWLQGSISIAAGGLLRQRILDGILHLASDEVRMDGAGRFLSRAIDTGLIESLALSGGLVAGLALIELAVATAVLASGAAGLLHAAALSACLALAGLLAWRYYRLRAAWTTTRLAMTHDLVERMTGHRTRLAQESPSRWHTSEDQAAQEYVTRSGAMDRALAWLTGFLPRAWLVLGIAALAPAFLGGRTAPAPLAISMGGILLAWQAMHRLTGGLANISGAFIAWRQVAPLFHAASGGVGVQSAAVAPSRNSEVVMDARDLSFQYRPGGARVLDGIDLQIRRGDWILLEGESGGGKSTLVSVLTGLRTGAGLLLLNGLDRQTLGSRKWRSFVAAAPQYQENHVLNGAFAFNLLMGRKWPAGAADIAEAEELCRELGLGPLLERMPGGIMQMVGETGWQLSQGERSRMFMARALLQKPDLVVLDESFGALDPETLRQALECVLRRVETLVVVAHP